MLTRDFWKIVLKVIGLWMALSSLLVIIQAVGSLYNTIAEIDNTAYIFITIMILGLALFFFLILRYLIYKPEFLIDKLKLDKNMETTSLRFNIHRSDAMKIALTIFGLLVIVDNLPHVISELYTYFQLKRILLFEKNRDNYWIIIYLLKVFLGVFLVYYNRYVVNLIEYSRRKKNGL